MIKKNTIIVKVKRFRIIFDGKWNIGARISSGNGNINRFGNSGSSLGIGGSPRIIYITTAATGNDDTGK